MTLDSFRIIQPDDCHVHLRDNMALQRTVGDTAQQFARAIVMPNLKAPITTIEAAKAYRSRILQAVPPGLDFTPLMTLYLTKEMTPDTIQQASNDPFIKGIKWYPKGATTHSEAGIEDITTLYPLLEKMEQCGMPLLIHGEVTQETCDVFDREKVFIEDLLKPLTRRFPTLKIILEHISTIEAVDFIEHSSQFLAATITPHHLLLNRNDLWVGGLQPHHYCLPILKHQRHQRRLIQAATSGNPKFFAGTDSAPHSKQKKESACGCAGIYSAYCAVALYASVFEAADALDKLESFMSRFGALFYGLPLNTRTLTLTRTLWTIPETLPFEQEQLIPLKAGETIPWMVVKEPQ